MDGLIKAGVECVLKNVDWKNAKESNTGDYCQDKKDGREQNKKSLQCAANTKQRLFI